MFYGLPQLHHDLRHSVNPVTALIACCLAIQADPCPWRTITSSSWVIIWRDCEMDLMFVSSQNSYVEALNFNMMLLGDVAFGT